MVLSTSPPQEQQQVGRRTAKREDNGLLLARAPNLGSLTQDSKCDNLNT